MTVYRHCRGPLAALTALLFALVGSGARAQDAQGGGSPSNRKARQAEIRILPGRVYLAGQHVLRAVLEPRRRASFSWSASVGRLLTREGEQVTWEAPKRGDSVRFEVEIRRQRLAATGAVEERVERIRREVRIHRASTRGMVRIPATGEQIKKEADKVVKMTIAKALKDSVNG